MAQGFNSLGNSMSAGFSGMTEQLTKLSLRLNGRQKKIKREVPYKLSPTFNKRIKVFNENGKWITTSPLVLNESY